MSDFSSSGAFAVAADAADDAASLVFDDAAAVGQAPLKKARFFVLHFVAVGGQVRLNGLGHGVAQDRILFSPKPEWECQEIPCNCLITCRACRPLRHASAHHAPDGFVLGRGAAAACPSW